MGKRKKIVIENVLIESYAAEGKALARIDNVVTFVTGVVPGDVCDILIRRKRKNFQEGMAIRISKYSELRMDAACAHFGTCGGCKWQNLDYAKQLEYKQQQVSDSMQRIGKVSIGLMQPIIGSDKQFHYRNKLEFSFSHRRWLTQEEIDSDQNYDDVPALGFHVPGRWDKVLDIDQCLLQDEPSNAIRNRVRQLAAEHGFSYYNLNKNRGFLRNLTIRNTTTGEWMAILSVGEDRKADIELILNVLAEEFPQLTSLMYVVNSKQNDTINDLQVVSFHGKDHIIEKMEGLQFRIGPKSFFQTNSPQAERLYGIVKEFAAPKSDDTIYDLYTGTGTIALYMASDVAKVIGIEYIEDAVKDAKLNAKLNGISNAFFVAGDMKDVFSPELVEEHGRPDIVITDPPRAGMHTDVIARLNELLPLKIVYVSCNPATQARDLQLLSDNYEVTRMQPVDMFPHTHHVENVALLQLREAKIDMMKLDQAFWNNRYEQEQMGWDIGAPSTPLRTFIDTLDDKSLKILIPGCGNAHEAEYLHQHGFVNVWLLDVAPLALERFAKRVPDFPKDHLIQADFFKTDGDYDLILEQTFFCALDPSLRNDYCNKMHGLLRTGGKLAGVMFGVPMSIDHPPFGGSAEEYRAIFKDKFNIISMASCENSIEPRSGTELWIEMTAK